MQLCEKCSHVITAGNGRTDSKGRHIHRGVSLPYLSNIGCPTGDTIQKNLEIARREIGRDAAREGREGYNNAQPFRPNPYEKAAEALEVSYAPFEVEKGEHGRRVDMIKQLLFRADAWDQGWLSSKDQHERNDRKKEVSNDRRNFISRLRLLDLPSYLGLPWSKK